MKDLVWFIGTAVHLSALFDNDPDCFRFVIWVCAGRTHNYYKLKSLAKQQAQKAEAERIERVKRTANGSVQKIVSVIRLWSRSDSSNNLWATDKPILNFILRIGFLVDFLLSSYHMLSDGSLFVDQILFKYKTASVTIMPEYRKMGIPMSGEDVHTLPTNRLLIGVVLGYNT